MGFSKQEYLENPSIFPTQGSNLCLLWFLQWQLGSLPLSTTWASLVAQMVKNLPVMQETGVQSPGWEDSFKKGIVTHSSILAWKIPRTVKPGRLWYMGSQTVKDDWETNTSHLISGKRQSSTFRVPVRKTLYKCKIFSFFPCNNRLVKSLNPEHVYRVFRLLFVTISTTAKVGCVCFYTTDNKPKELPLNFLTENMKD